MTKVSVVGGGNAGCITALYLSWHNKDLEVELIYNPDIPCERVGQASVIDQPKLLWAATGFNWYNKHAYDDTIEAITSHDPKSIGSLPIQENSYFTALKFGNPWDIITPPGWSVIITQPWYYRNLDIEILPSIIDTDIYHQMNIHFLYHGIGEKTFIQGMPLIQVIPIKREELENYKVSTRDKEDQIYYTKSRAAERTKFHGWYRWLTKMNKKRWKEQGIL